MAASSVDVLLSLLDHVDDAATLEHLLEPPHLRTLLHAEGHDDAWIRSALATRSPGELLLSLFQDGRTAPDLLARLPAMAPKPAKPTAPPKASGSSAGGSTTRGRNGSTGVMPARAAAFGAPMTLLNQVGGIVAIAVPTIGALLASGVFPLWSLGAPTRWTVIGAVGASIGLAMHARGRVSVFAGLVGGAVVGGGAVAAVAAWMAIRPTLTNAPMIRLELIAALLVGALPGILAYAMLGAVLPGRREYPAG